MERTVLRVTLVLVCAAGLWLCAFGLIGPEAPSVVVTRTTLVALIVLVAALLSLAAAQAWDRGARVRAVLGLVTVGTAAATAIYATLVPEAARHLFTFLADAVGGAFVTLVFCGLAVVEAPPRDRWIGSVAAQTFTGAYGIFVVAQHAHWAAVDLPIRVGAALFFAGMAATAAYSARARQARLAARASASPPR